MYRITCEAGNGYHCSCCRSSWEETVDFETPEEVKAWVLDLQVDKADPDIETPDRDILEINKIEEEDLTSKFSPTEEEIQVILDERAKGKKAKKEAEAKKRKAKKAQRAKEKEQKDKIRLQELAIKYPEELK